MTAERDDLRDDIVARTWREHATEAPPTSIDDAIRAAARRAVGAKPRVEPVAEAREPWRWWMPLAAAATIGAVAIGVLQNLPQDAIEPTIVSDAATTRSAAPVEAARPQIAAASSAEVASAPTSKETTVAGAPAQPSAPPRQSAAVVADAVAPVPQEVAPMARSEEPQAPAAKRTTPFASKDAAPRESGAGRAQETDTRNAALEKRRDETASSNPGASDASGFVPSPPASPPAVAAPAPAMQAAASAPMSAPPAATGAIGSGRLAASAADAAPRSKVEAAPARAAQAPMASSSAGASAQPETMAVTPPDVFIAEIRRLLAAGDRDGAVRELQRFRRTHVDANARLPEDLKAFGASVPR